MTSRAFFAGAWLALGTSIAAVPGIAQTAPATPLQVQIEGAVEQPGTYRVAPGGRISTAVVAAQPNERAYPLGAAWLRREQIQAQTRLKAGLLYDLQALQSQAKVKADTGTTAAALQTWLEPLQVTGRVAHQLEPRALEVSPDANLPLAEGDRIIYPLRPTSVRVVGAVAQLCELPHVALADARQYLQQCPLRSSASKDDLYVIQPDGHVEKLGIALWNRSAPYALAPGAVIYVPIAEHLLDELDPEFNAQFARFIATQVLPAPGVSP